VVWQGQTYSPFPVQVEGLDFSAKGPLPRPTIRVSNVDGTLGALVRQYDDLVGASVVCKRCLAKHLDAVNFPGGVNPTADPTAHWDDETFEVEQKTSETKDVIEFQLASAMDAQGIRLPRRLIQATVCGWTNADTAICSFVATCDRRLATCKVNFGATNPLPFGGFPAANRVK
jgi:lambda family phage minor tail protein L